MINLRFSGALHGTAAVVSVTQLGPFCFTSTHRGFSPTKSVGAGFVGFDFLFGFRFIDGLVGAGCVRLGI